MKIKLTQPLPQIGRVIPAGVLIEDAPYSLKERLVKQGKAVWAFEDDDDRGDGDNSVPVSPVMPAEETEEAPAAELPEVPEETPDEEPAETPPPAHRRKKGGKPNA